MSDTAATWVIAAAAVVTAAGVLWRALSGFFARVNRVMQLTERELRPNGGASLRDQMAQVAQVTSERLPTDLAARLTGIEDDLSGLRGAVHDNRIIVTKMLARGDRITQQAVRQLADQGIVIDLQDPEVQR